MFVGMIIFLDGMGIVGVVIVDEILYVFVVGLNGE